MEFGTSQRLLRVQKDYLRNSKLILRIQSRTSNLIRLFEKHDKEKKEHVVSEFRKYVISICSSQWFNFLVFFIIMANLFTIAYDVTVPRDQNRVTYILDAMFLGFYLFEFCVKVYAEPREYWLSNYNLFDFFVLVVSLVQQISVFFPVEWDFSFIRVLRALRTISSFKKLRIIVNALFYSMRTDAVSIFSCLFVFMFLFAVMGYYLFGTGSHPSSDFSSLPVGLMTLMNYVTSSNWSTVQYNLINLGFPGSELFGVAFMFIGNFIFPNSTKILT